MLDHHMKLPTQKAKKRENSILVDLSRFVRHAIFRDQVRVALDQLALAFPPLQIRWSFNAQVGPDPDVTLGPGTIPPSPFHIITRVQDTVAYLPGPHPGAGEMMLCTGAEVLHYLATRTAILIATCMQALCKGCPSFFSEAVRAAHVVRLVTSRQTPSRSVQSLSQSSSQPSQPSQPSGSTSSPTATSLPALNSPLSSTPRPPVNIEIDVTVLPRCVLSITYQYHDTSSAVTTASTTTKPATSSS
eukprot:TRINITY_DN21585_c0_g1::TRINITY_DN21585_c0_g1_i1::g.15002::m.15002 TRINITY_DN21585_c0_g1::TRINITY_DN21585_c0_g1_i1::g.15002  ORF type:complete len:245 (+),score=27.98 TRINITY_DN21585_c0_g1_i1:1-735(+)